MGMGARHPFDLFTALVAKEFKVRYKSTILGFFWSLLNPALFAVVFYIAFHKVLRVQTENFFVFLLVGLFPWQWFAGSVAASPSVFLSNASMVKTVAIPRLLLPAATATNYLLHFLLTLPVATVLLMLTGSLPSPTWIVGIPVLLLIQAGVTLGACLLVSSLNVFFRDLEHLTGIFLNLLFYVTPIIFPVQAIPAELLPVFRLNPLYYIIPCWHDLVLRGILDWERVATGAGVSALVLALGVALYKRVEWRFAEAL